MKLNKVTASICVTFTALFFVLASGLAIVTPSGEPNVFGVLWPAPFAAMALVGALVVVRRAENATGWLLLGGGSLMVANAFAQGYAQYAFSAPRTLPATDLITWFGFWTWMPATVMVGLVLIVFPTGRPLSWRWRWVVRAGVVAIALVPIAALFTLGASGRSMVEASTPADVEGGALLGALGTVPLQAFLPLGFIALVVRFIKSRGVERQQMKWFVFGTSMLAVAAVVPFFLNTDDPISHPVGAATVGIGMTAIPATAGIAIMRYRLYDIDRIISRTSSYAIITTVLGGVFALVVVGPALVVGVGSAPDYVIAAATLIVAALFRPVRRRVQHAVDHRFNRRRYDAARTIEAFTARLRDEIDIDALHAELSEVVRRTMQPAHVSLWLRNSTP